MSHSVFWFARQDVVSTLVIANVEDSPLGFYFPVCLGSFFHRILLHRQIPEFRSEKLNLFNSGQNAVCRRISADTQHYMYLLKTLSK